MSVAEVSKPWAAVSGVGPLFRAVWSARNTPRRLHLREHFIAHGRGSEIGAEALLEARAE